MHPELLHLGPFTLPTYGAAFAFSVLLAVILAVRRSIQEGFDENRILNVAVLAILGIIVGSKSFHIVLNLGWYLKEPGRFLDLRTGHVYYGGYIGAILLPAIYIRLVKERFLPVLDIFATYMPLGLAIHRAFGCLNAGCCHGRPTDLPWGIVFPEGSPAFKLYGMTPVHPTQLYESALAMFIFLALLAWRRRCRKVPGELFTLQAGLYAVGRFVIEFFRGDTSRGFYGPLSTSQWVSIGMLALVAFMVVYLRRKRRELKQGRSA